MVNSDPKSYFFCDRLSIKLHSTIVSKSILFLMVSVSLSFLPQLLMAASQDSIGQDLTSDLLGTKPGLNGQRTYDCIVKPYAEFDLSSPVSGVIAKTYVDRGTVISAGDVVADLASDVEKANLRVVTRKAMSEEKIRSAEVRIEFLKRKLERNQRLNEQKVVPTETVEEARTELQIAAEDLNTERANRELAVLEKEQAEATLAQKVIRSPTGGVVTRLLRKPGEFTAEQTPIAHIAAIDPLYVEAFLPISLHGTLRNGVKATVITEAPAGRQFEAEVTNVDRVYDAASGTFGVRLTLPNPRLEIPAGIRCDLLFRNNMEAKP